MREDIQESLNKIGDLMPMLNESVDRAAEIVVSVEKFLKEYSVGIPVCVGLNEVGDIVGRDLTYERFNGNYRIVVRWGAESAPWLDCSRHQKLTSYRALPELIKNIAEEVKRLSKLTTP